MRERTIYFTAETRRADGVRPCRIRTLSLRVKPEKISD